MMTPYEANAPRPLDPTLSDLIPFPGTDHGTRTTPESRVTHPRRQHRPLWTQATHGGSAPATALAHRPSIPVGR